MNKLVFVHMETKHTWGWGALHSGEGLYTLCALVENKITMLKLKTSKQERLRNAVSLFALRGRENRAVKGDLKERGRA